MSDLIEREDAIKALEELSACEEYGVEVGTDEETYIGKYEAITEISDLPSARPKGGKWIFRGDGKAICADCGKSYDWDFEAQYYNFCPNCGAKMKGVDDE